MPHILVIPHLRLFFVTFSHSIFFVNAQHSNCPSFAVVLVPSVRCFVEGVLFVVLLTLPLLLPFCITHSSTTFVCALSPLVTLSLVYSKPATCLPLAVVLISRVCAALLQERIYQALHVPKRLYPTDIHKLPSYLRAQRCQRDNLLNQGDLSSYTLT